MKTKAQTKFNKNINFEHDKPLPKGVLIYDISEGLELYPIPVINTLENSHLPNPLFSYTKSVRVDVDFKKEQTRMASLYKPWVS